MRFTLRALVAPFLTCLTIVLAFASIQTRAPVLCYITLMCVFVTLIVETHYQHVAIEQEEPSDGVDPHLEVHDPTYYPVAEYYGFSGSIPTCEREVEAAKRVYVDCDYVGREEAMLSALIVLEDKLDKILRYKYSMEAPRPEVKPQFPPVKVHEKDEVPAPELCPCGCTRLLREDPHRLGINKDLAHDILPKMGRGCGRETNLDICSCESEIPCAPQYITSNGFYG